MTIVISSKEEFYTGFMDPNPQYSDVTVDIDVIIDSSTVNWNFKIIENVAFNKLVKVQQSQEHSGMLMRCCLRAVFEV